MLTGAIALFLGLTVLVWPTGEAGVWSPHDLRDANENDPEGLSDNVVPGVTRERGTWLRLKRFLMRGRGAGGGPAGLDEVVELVAVGLEAGLSVSAAIEVLTQLHLDPPQVAALSHLLATVDPDPSDRPPGLGEAPAAAVDHSSRSVAPGVDEQSGAAAPELAFVLAAAALSARSGAPLSAALRLAAEVTRSELSARERQAVLMAGPKASMMLLTLLPIAGPMLAWSLGWDPFAQPAVIYLLIGLGGVCTLLGWLWSRRLVRGAGRVTCLAPDPTRASAPATVLDLARAVDLMPLALLTGCGSTEAIELVAQVVSGRVAADLNVAVAARRWHIEPGREWQLAGPAWSSVGIAWRTADRAGAAPAGLLAATAARIRRTEAAQIEARIQRAGVLLVLPLGLCFLPGFLLTTVVPVVADLVTRVL